MRCRTRSPAGTRRGIGSSAQAGYFLTGGGQSHDPFLEKLLHSFVSSQIFRQVGYRRYRHGRHIGFRLRGGGKSVLLSKAQNDLITQTGSGTPGGRLLRSYWQPIATSDEIPVGGEPMAMRIMSEDLVLFRDDSDQLGLIGRYCPHRGTDLSYGRVENGGLRCLYHGWLFDIHGKCLEQPAEPASRKFCHKVRLANYPVQEKGGVIWTYMGEGEPPLIPNFQFLTAPEANRIAFRTILKCNWLQALESSTDPT